MDEKLEERILQESQSIHITGTVPGLLYMEPPPPIRYRCSRGHEWQVEWHDRNLQYFNLFGTHDSRPFCVRCLRELLDTLPIGVVEHVRDDEPTPVVVMDKLSADSWTALQQVQQLVREGT